MTKHNYFLHDIFPDKMTTFRYRFVHSSGRTPESVKSDTNVNHKLSSWVYEALLHAFKKAVSFVV